MNRTRNTRPSHALSHLFANPFAHLAVVVTASAVLFAACGADGRSTADNATPGADAYAANCASCHGANLEGTTMGPSLLSEIYAPDHHSDQSIRNAVINGVQPHHWNFGAMPAVGLDDDTITEIIAYIRTSQTTEGFQPYPPTP